MHANFVENAGGATAADCVALMVEARRRAHQQHGVVLEREVVFAGLPELVGGRSARGSRRQVAAADVVVPFPRGAAGARLDLVRFVPSGRSLLVTMGLLLAVGAAYFVAYSTPVFALERVQSSGAPPELAREVHAATRELTGRSLVGIDAEEVEGKLRSLPAVAGVSVDRAFPHTLEVRIAPERPVAVIRRGRSSWLATGAGKVIRSIETGTQRHFPRLWLAKGATIRLGGQIPPGFVPATRALAEAHAVGLGARIKGVRLEGEELTLVLRRGTELRLGRATEVGLKLTVASKVLRMVDGSVSYVDVSVPQRAVAG
jgi:cell division protein FtsQ